MKYALAILVLLTASPLIAADRYTIRENHPYGEPNTFQRGTVIESNGDGSYTAREEVLPGTGWGNTFDRGTVIEPNRDGSYTAREEILPGTGWANPMDKGYTITPE